MKCKKCGEEIAEESVFCQKCGAKVKEENVSKKSTGKKVAIVLVIIVIIAAIVAVAVIAINRNENNSEENQKENAVVQDSANMQANGMQSLSFSNMNADDENLTEQQRAVINYFDNDYLYLYYDIENLQKYPQIFENAKVYTIGGVVKVLESTDEEFEVLMFDDCDGYYYGDYPTGEYTLTDSSDRLYILKGEQLNERLVERDFIQIYGRYVGVETREINGNTYTIPVISAMNVSDYGEDKFDADTIRNVAKYIFGEDVKVSEHDEMDYLVTLDNQSNANFKAFDMSKSEGIITYDIDYNNLSDNIIKKLFISSDFNHYIVSTYDSSLKYVYIDYFDKNLNKLWSREFEYNSTDSTNYSPMDYNETQMSIVIDNDLYLIDLETGENIIEPVLVGNKTKVLMMNDGVILIGKENKDLIMKVDFDGKILYRIDGDTNLTKVEYIATQIVDGKLIVRVSGMDENAIARGEENIDLIQIEKYMVINNDGTVEYSTKDLSGYRG